MDESPVHKRMQDVFDLTSSDLATIRTGRVTPSLVEDIVVPAYGGTQRLKVVELASITAQDARTLVIEPWDKSIVGEIRKGILEANVGLNPVLEETRLRISLPEMTSEDRQNYVKLLSKKLEAGRIMIRQVRGDFMKKIKEDFENKLLSEDEKFDAEKRLQEITDEYIQKIDQAGKAKEEEILQV